VAVGPGDALSLETCTRTRMPPEDLAALGQAVDVNIASETELASLPGIGPTLAGRIVGGRPYADLESLLAVPGIGPARLAAIRARVRFEPELRLPNR